MLYWEFQTWARGDKVRDPVQGEFFATEAIKNPAQAFVREAVQNSLDAGTGSPVRVRFYISEEEGAVPAARMARYLNGSWPHFTADGNGLRDVPSSTDSCPFLVCEDFSTRGLEGDPTQWQEIPGQNNHFYYFFRTEGKSAKTEQERGRWGIGKYVFPRSSRINSFLAVTVRRDNSRLLMGQAVLKSHSIGDKYYKPDGLLGRDVDGLIMPFEEATLINEFCADFKLKRATQAGLSVVVPWHDREITFDHLVKAAAGDYFYAILKGDLVIDIESPSKTINLSASTIEPTLAAHAPDLSRELAALFALAKWSVVLDSQSFTPINVPPPAHSYKWEDVTIPEELIATLRTKVQTSERIAVRIYLDIRAKDKASAQSFFDIFIVRDETDSNGRPSFIRAGIIISDVRPPHRNRGMRALVVVEDPPLATLLGDSENPAHTQWQRESSNFKSKYNYGPSYITFVTGSVAAIVRAIVATEQEIDPTLLTDFFPSPSGGDGAQEDSAGDKDKDKKQKTTKKIDTPVRKPQRFHVNRVKGGFSVTPGDANAAPSPRIEIRAAYDVRRGNAMSRYRPEDFRLDKSPIKTKTKGLDILDCEDNRILVAVQDKDFYLTVNGFDENRDLVIRATVKGDAGDTTV